MDIRLILGGNIPINPARSSRSQTTNMGESRQPSPTPSFDGVLRQFIAPPAEGLKISSHAEKRLQERQIPMTDELRADLEKAITELQAKGSRDSLVLRGEEAFLVHVPSRTLVTAMSRDDMHDKIITQIDSVSIKTLS